MYSDSLRSTCKRRVIMKTKKDDDVNKEKNLEKQQQSEKLSIEEQLEFFAELLIDHLLNDKQENEN